MDVEKIAAGLSGVQKAGVLSAPTHPNACCPSPTLLAGPDPIWRLRRQFWLFGPHVWDLTKTGKAVRAHLEKTDATK